MERHHKDNLKKFWPKLAKECDLMGLLPYLYCLNNIEKEPLICHHRNFGNFLAFANHLPEALYRKQDGYKNLLEALMMVELEYFVKEIDINFYYNYKQKTETSNDATLNSRQAHETPTVQINMHVQGTVGMQVGDNNRLGIYEESKEDIQTNSNKDENEPIEVIRRSCDTTESQYENDSAENILIPEKHDENSLLESSSFHNVLPPADAVPAEVNVLNNPNISPSSQRKYNYDSSSPMTLPKTQPVNSVNILEEDVSAVDILAYPVQESREQDDVGTEVKKLTEPKFSPALSWQIEKEETISLTNTETSTDIKKVVNTHDLSKRIKIVNESLSKVKLPNGNTAALADDHQGFCSSLNLTLNSHQESKPKSEKITSLVEVSPPSSDLTSDSYSYSESELKKFDSDLSLQSFNVYGQSNNTDSDSSFILSTSHSSESDITNTTDNVSEEMVMHKQFTDGNSGLKKRNTSQNIRDITTNKSFHNNSQTNNFSKQPRIVLITIAVIFMIFVILYIWLNFYLK